jgi:hypothetical protein
MYKYIKVLTQLIKTRGEGDNECGVWKVFETRGEFWFHRV